MSIVKKVQGLDVLQKLTNSCFFFSRNPLCLGPRRDQGYVSAAILVHGVVSDLEAPKIQQAQVRETGKDSHGFENNRVIQYFLYIN